LLFGAECGTLAFRAGGNGATSSSPAARDIRGEFAGEPPVHRNGRAGQEGSVANAVEVIWYGDVVLIPAMDLARGCQLPNVALVYQAVADIVTRKRPALFGGRHLKA
jgi:hypothetical protein